MFETSEKKIIAFVVEYGDFLKLPEEKRQKMRAEKRVEWRVYIPRERADLLTPAEMEQLNGFKITHIEPVKIRTFSPKEMFPVPKEMPVLIDTEKQSKHEKRAERQRLKRMVPLKIGVVNNKRKGGR